MLTEYFLTFPVFSYVRPFEECGLLNLGKIRKNNFQKKFLLLFQVGPIHPSKREASGEIIKPSAMTVLFQKIHKNSANCPLKKNVKQQQEFKNNLIRYFFDDFIEML